jgi:hypothetical protein
MAGIYTLHFRGAAGWGMGLLELRDGIAAGADMAGALYDGTYEETDEDLTLKMHMTVPPGVTLAQGTAPKPVQYSVDFNARIPKGSIESGEPILVDLPPGPLNVIVARLRALPN